tara:strand:+ start:960 stop:1262 length:303 start_codon:yes stop_codon:yes gene_type:complete
MEKFFNKPNSIANIAIILANYLNKIKMNKEKYFKLSLKKLVIIIGAWFVSVILHNLVSAIFGFEDALFFILAIVVIPAYFIICIIYSIFKIIKSKIYSPG